MRTHPKTTKILQLLRLRQLHTGVFVRMNKATVVMVTDCCCCAITITYGICLICLVTIG
jgi:hypothetical protein